MISKPILFVKTIITEYIFRLGALGFAQENLGIRDNTIPANLSELIYLNLYVVLNYSVLHFLGKPQKKVLLLMTGPLRGGRGGKGKITLF